MSRHRFFLEGDLPIVGDGETLVVPLSSNDLHHAVAVLRVRPGEEIDVVASSGRVWRVEVVSATRDALTARVSQLLDIAPAAGAKVTLVFGVSKGSKNDEIVESAVEIGASEIRPVLTARSVVRYDSVKRSVRGERWRRVALAAAKQSKRAAVPAVHDPAMLSDVLPLLAQCDVLLVAWEDAPTDGIGIRDAMAAAEGIGAESRVTLVVGPEGGLAPEEIDSLVGAGGVVVTLGPVIMRVETAAIVGCSLVVYECGGLGNGSRS